MSIKKLRKEIDKIDQQIIKLLEKRALIAKEIGRLKEKQKLPITDLKREKEILKKLKNLTKDILLKEKISEIYQIIFSLSKDYRNFHRNKNQPFNKIGIIGVGLIGGSIVKCLKLKNKNLEIYALKRKDIDTQQAIKDNYLKDILDLEDLIKFCELIIISTPILNIIPIAKEIQRLASKIDKNLIIIDTGSTKEKIVKEFEKLTNNKIEFLGTHPMAGSEKSGFENASPTLFLNYPWIITPHSKNKRSTIASIKKFVEFLGAKPFVLTPQKHDEIIAKVSHLIFLISTLLFVYTHETGKEFIKFSGTGFKTTTKLASSNPYMKYHIFITNKNNIVNEFKKFIRFLTKFKFDENKLLKFFIKYKNIRDKYLDK